jgi:hypothetical protein
MTISHFRSIGLNFAVFAAFCSQQLSAQEGVRADRIMGTSELEQQCSYPENTSLGVVNQAHCLGFIIGVADAAMTLNAVMLDKQLICLEESDDADSMRLTFLAFVRRNPETRSLPAATTVIAMLNENYACEVPQ